MNKKTKMINNSTTRIIFENYEILGTLEYINGLSHADFYFTQTPLDCNV